MSSCINKKEIDFIRIRYEGNHKNEIFINQEEKSNDVLLPVDIVFDGEFIKLSYTIDFYDLILKQDIHFIFHPESLKQKCITLSNRYEMLVEEFKHTNDQLKLKGKLSYINDFTEKFIFEILKIISN